jgi:hypothetical protein
MLPFPQIVLEQLPEGDAGIFRTAEHLVDLIRSESNSFFVRQCAQSIIRGVQERDKKGEVKACFNFVKENVRYTNDMIGMEYIQSPTYILGQLLAGKMVMGDCDDSVCLLLSLLRSIGYLVRVKITGYADSQEFTHVYGEVLLNDIWVPVDSIVKEHKVGDEAPGIMRVRIYEVS